MQYLYIGLDAAPFAPLATLDDSALSRLCVRRVICDASPGMPCRVSLQDALPGESVLLLHHLHHDTGSPYRASGPIYVRAGAIEAFGRRAAPPPMLRTRLLSLRGYDRKGFLREADVVDGTQLEHAVARAFAAAKVDYVHVHFAKPGCYACAVRRADPALPTH